PPRRPPAHVPSARPRTTAFPVIRPPPLSPLFPYTTLFRSVRHPQHPAHPARRAEHAVSAFVSQVTRLLRAIGGGTGEAQHVVLRDRKSTRLNSSHVKISYAVFCLKKKTTTYLRNSKSTRRY